MSYYLNIGINIIVSFVVTTMGLDSSILTDWEISIFGLCVFILTCVLDIHRNLFKKVK